MKLRHLTIPIVLTITLCAIAGACSSPGTPASAPSETTGLTRLPPSTQTPIPSQPPTSTSSPIPSPTATHEPEPVFTPTPLLFHIEADGSGDFPGLVEAVKNAPAGAMLSLGAGVYRLDQGLEIDKPLSLVGQGMDKTEIVSSAGEYTVHISVKGAFSAEGITFRHQGEAFADAVEVEEAQVAFKSCRFSGGVINPQGKQRGSGLRLREKASGIVQDCVAEENFTGIFVLAQQVTLERNLSKANMAGIGFGADSNALARDNQAQENQYNGFAVGLDAHPTLEGNTSSKNGQNGFLFLDEASGSVLNNVCSQNQGSGIAMEGQAHPVLDGNTCSQNTLHGIVIAGNARGEARRNECSENQMSGILVADSAQATIEENSCNKNSRFGIAIGNQAQAIVRRNTCNQNLRAGILVAENASAALEENVCSKNIQAGIAFLDNASGSATRNQCVDNETGIFVAATSNPELTNNDCHDNTKDDILDER